MSSLLRARVVCVTKEPTCDAVMVRLVTSGKPENDAVFRWSPGGSIRLNCLSPETAEQFTVDKEYYLDLTEIPKEQ